jgi:MYXO-CTERM domain-containing protein
LYYAAAVRRWTAWILGVAALLCAAPLSANGRFPESQKLIEDPRDPNRLLLAGTAGLLITEDRGQNWYYLCEQAFALEQIEGDPLLELLPNGELLSGLIATLNRSTDCGCTWTARLAEPELVTLLDLSLEKSGDRAVLALTRDLSINPEIYSLQESRDAGQTWTKVSDLPAEVEEAFTLDSAPSDASRIYVSALMKSGTGALLVSTDRGAGWQTRNFAGADINNQAYIAAVHPTNAEVVFVRTNGWDQDNTANDALFYTDDGGQTWTELIRRQGKLFGFALSPDATRVVVGYGDPYQAASFTTTEDLGLYIADTGQTSFTKIFHAAISCLSWTGRGLYACHAEGLPDFDVDFTLGFAPNADFTEATPDPLSSLLKLPDVRGPLGCAAAVCADDWTMPSEFGDPVCERFGAQCTGPADGPEPPCGSAGPPGGTGGAAGTNGTGGTVDAGGGTGGAGAVTGSGGTTPGSGATGGTGASGGGSDDGGCGCRTVPASPATLSALLIALLASPLARRRRRRSSR